MHFILPYFIVLIIIFQVLLRNNTKKRKDSLDTFWKREQEANSVRRKDISQLDYITIPNDLPMVTTDNHALLQAQHTIETLRTHCKEHRILNLSNQSNTDLKLAYGVANLNTLTECDDRFTQLIRALDIAGRLTFEEEHPLEGVQILEYAVSIGSDIRSTYTTLTDFYHAIDDTDAFDKLLTHANALQSITKEPILAYMKMPHQRR